MELISDFSEASSIS